LAAGEVKEGRVAEGVRHAYTFSTFNSLSAVYPSGLLAPLTTGLSDLYPISYTVGQEARPTEQIENPLALLVGRFDLTYVMLYLLPLLILALSFNLTAAEKESGILSLLLSQPISLRILILGKIALRAFLIFGSLLVLAGIGAVLSGIDFRVEGALPRLLLWFMAVFAYGAFWFGLAVLVNAFGRGARINALVLAVYWLTLIILIPTLLNFAAAVIYPVPPRAELVDAQRVIYEEVRVRDLPPDKLRNQYFANHPEFSPNGDYPEFGYALIVREAEREEIKRRMQPIEKRFAEPLARQQALIDRTQFLSPAVLLQQTLYAFAGTDRFRYEGFLRQRDDYHKNWNAFFNPKRFDETPFTSSDYRKIPRFVFVEESFADVSKRVVAPMTALALISFAIIFFGIYKYKSYSVVE
jgi:ABC-2 type transport system permease protein